MEQAITRHEEGNAALARVEDGIPIERLIARVKKVREVQRELMVEGQHYGRIPGVDKPTLLKPGAEMLGLAFQLAPDFACIEHRDSEHLEVVVTCTLYHAPTGTKLGSGIGSCSTMESKYAYRNGQRSCPECGVAAIRKSKDKPEWYCWRKIDGCGKTFGINDKTITEQVVGRVANPDLPDQYNTVRKMACKRAHVAATLFVCGASEIFTQDVEDLPRDDAGNSKAPPQQRPAAGKPSQNQAPAKSAKPTAEFIAMTRALDAAGSIAELEDLVPELALLRDQKVVTAEEYRKLREAYGRRVLALAPNADDDGRETNSSQGEPVDADEPYPGSMAS